MKPKPISSVLSVACVSPLPKAASEQAGTASGPTTEAAKTPDTASVEIELPLSPEEKELCEKHREVIREGWGEVGKTLVKMGHALAAIRDSRLYRGDYTTFEDFCRHEYLVFSLEYFWHPLVPFVALKNVFRTPHRPIQ